MRTWMRRTVIATVATAALLGVGATAASAAESTPRAASVGSAPVTTQAYIYGYYRNYLDCEVAGAQGLYYGYWHNYVCDNRYVPGYFALVIAG
jgi:hypothetical protein